MTRESIDLHPSHKWHEEQGHDFNYLRCSECLACSHFIGSGATGNCIGSEGLEKELLND